MIADAAGIPLAVILTGGHRNDVTPAAAGRDPADRWPARKAAATPRQGRRRPRRRPRHLPPAAACTGITPVIARRGTAYGSGLGRRRWIVERTLAWLHAFRRLRTRYQRRVDTHHAMISLACSIICLRRLRTLR